MTEAQEMTAKATAWAIYQESQSPLPYGKETMTDFTIGNLAPEIIRAMSADDRNRLGLRLPEEAKAALDAKLEKKLQQDCEAVLRLHGIEKHHLSFRAREKKGWPDLVFAIHSRACAVELKREDGKLSKEQMELLERLAAPPNEWEVRVIRSLESFIKFVQEIEARK